MKLFLIVLKVHDCTCMLKYSVSSLMFEFILILMQLVLPVYIATTNIKTSLCNPSSGTRSLPGKTLKHCTYLQSLPGVLTVSYVIANRGACVLDVMSQSCM